MKKAQTRAILQIFDCCFDDSNRHWWSFIAFQKRIRQLFESRILRSRVLLHQKCWQGLCKTSIKTKRRKEFIANFRRKTAHDLLNQHLNRFGLVPSPLCDLCQEENETSSHLYECKAITDCTDVMKKLFKNEEELFSEIYWHFRSLKISWIK